MKNNKEIQIAMSSLFIEMAKADGYFSKEELTTIIKVLKERFSLTNEEINSLLKQSMMEVEESISISEFTAIIRDEYSAEDKFEFILNLWRLIYTDKRLDMYEDSLIKKICATIGVSHKEMINAKMLIRKELNLD